MNTVTALATLVGDKCILDTRLLTSSSLKKRSYMACMVLFALLFILLELCVASSSCSFCFHEGSVRGLKFLHSLTYLQVRGRFHVVMIETYGINVFDQHTSTVEMS